MKNIILIVFLFMGISLAQGQTGEEFDFWVGTWNLSWDGGQGKIGKGVNHIEKILDGKVIQENFEATDAGSITGFKGSSLSVYNPATKTWHQAWADNQGGYFNFVGETEAGARIFKTVPQVQNGQEVISRMVFKNITDDALTWDWERTTDGGKTWTLQWRINYQRAE